MRESGGSYVGWIAMALFMVLSFSCKSGKVVADGTVDEGLSSKTVIKNHYERELQFKTLSARLKIAYSDGTSSQNFSVSLRMEKDSVIWISAPLGVVKAYIAPGRVSFYNKLQNEYFDGDFTYLSGLLGTTLDFEKVQNLLLGQALFNLRDEKYTVLANDEHYELKPKKAAEFLKTVFLIEPVNFKIATQQLSQPLEKRLLEVRYERYEQNEDKIYPNTIKVMAIETDKRTLIDLEYRNVEFNRALSFPYKIPKGFNEIVLR